MKFYIQAGLFAGDMFVGISLKVPNCICCKWIACCKCPNRNDVDLFLTRMHSSRMRTVRNSSRLPGGCTWSRGVYLVRGGLPGPQGGCTWSPGGVYLVRGGLPGPQGGCTWSPGGVYLVRGGVPGLGGTWSGGVCTWSWGGSCPGTPPHPLWTDRHV